jgi:hypothetical protein
MNNRVGTYTRNLSKGTKLLLKFGRDTKWATRNLGSEVFILFASRSSPFSLTIRFAESSTLVGQAHSLLIRPQSHLFSFGSLLSSPFSHPPEFWEVGGLLGKWVVKGMVSSLPFVDSSGYKGNFIGVPGLQHTGQIPANHPACSFIPWSKLHLPDFTHLPSLFSH